MVTFDAILRALRNRGIATARELMADLGISQPTVSRLLHTLRGQLITWKCGRVVRYAAIDLNSIFRKGLPLYQVDRAGGVFRNGLLFPIYGGRIIIQYENSRFEEYPGLPWFIEDLRPQGFIGRLLGRSMAREGFPPDPRLWSTEQVLSALANTHDLPGNLLVGETARDLYLGSLVEPPSVVQRADYELLIARQSAGLPPGSSAGGEQPKFLCLSPPPHRHLLVKYSPLAGPQENDATRRWAQLLVCEQIALDTLCAAGIAAARAELIEQENRRFLEVERFDRTLEGRVQVFSGLMSFLQNYKMNNRDSRTVGWGLVPHRLKHLEFI